MVDARNKSDKAVDALIVIIMIVIGIIMLYPMLYELMVSFSEPAQLVRHRGLLIWPLGFDTTAYKLVLSNNQILSGYKNTLFLLVAGLAVNISMTCLGAYCLTRVHVYWHRLMTMFVLITMYFSGGLIPSYLTVRAVGLYNYFSSIPESLVESVFIDGGGHMTVLFKIFIPLSLPAMAVMVLYYGVGHWNSWFNANLYLQEKAKWPLQLVLRNVLIEGSNLDLGGTVVADYEMLAKSMKAAMVIVTTVPILAIYPFLQKYFVGGMMIGSLKE